MPLIIYNSLTRRKEEFVPLDPERVLFYNCGPTVYGEFHIGNARNFVVFDVIRRWLGARGYTVEYVQNITDVDDKIIAKAAEERTTPEMVAERYTAYFLQKLSDLGNLPATAHPRATQHIGAMIAMIRTLEEKGHAYASSDGSVWFSVESFPEYGKLSGLPLDQMQSAGRLSEEEKARKRSPLDFALWKGAKEGEPAWDSPWGRGRPGWHIECSCMSIRVLGSETIDLHGGGVDLRFPHHENEIAQSECATGKPFARYWLHNGMLDIDGEKMSKSLGNVRTIDDVLARTDRLTLRYFLLTARYRDKLELSDASFQSAQSAVRRLVTAGREAGQRLRFATIDASWRKDPACAALWEEFAAGMDDDFNTPVALAAIAKAVTEVNRARTEVEAGAGPELLLARWAALLEQMRFHLGLGEELEEGEEEGFDPATDGALRTLAGEAGVDASGVEAAELVTRLVEARTGARKAKNFALADQLRDGLQQLGIALEDKPGETIWRRFR